MGLVSKVNLIKNCNYLFVDFVNNFENFEFFVKQFSRENELKNGLAPM